jgi:hypothetical protein
MVLTMFPEKRTELRMEDAMLGASDDSPSLLFLSPLKINVNFGICLRCLKWRSYSFVVGVPRVGAILRVEAHAALALGFLHFLVGCRNDGGNNFFGTELFTG